MPMPIGPEIPAHLLNPSKAEESDDEDEDAGPHPADVGPRIPAHLLNLDSNLNANAATVSGFRAKGTTVQVFDEDDEEGDGDGDGDGAIQSIGPSVPPHPHLQKPTAVPTPTPTSRLTPKKTPRTERSVAGPSMPPPSSTFTSTSQVRGKRPIGPTLPSYAATYEPRSGYTDEHEHESDSDDDVGPKPLPAGMQHVEADPVREFMEREEKRRKLAEEAAKPKTAKRDEWMLVPPTSSSLLGNLDPTKLKARQFSRGTPSAVTSSKQDTSLWTETPAERQQRLADEVSGRKRRVTDAPVEEGLDEKARKRRRKEEEEAIRRGVDEHTRKKRGAALVDQHADGSKKTAGEAESVPGIWDHSRDMGLGGRLMDDDKRNKMLKEARGLGDRFGSGKGGGFL